MREFVTKFFEIPSDVNFWQIVNSQALATAVGAVVALLVARYGSKAALAATDAAAAQEAASAVAKAKQIEIESDAEVDAPEEVPHEADFRSSAKASVERAKEYLREKAGSDSDGRHRRTYDAIARGRIDYTALAVALNERDQLSSAQFDAAAKLFSEWRAYERGRAASKKVPRSVHEEINRLLTALRRE